MAFISSLHKHIIIKQKLPSRASSQTSILNDSRQNPKRLLFGVSCLRLYSPSPSWCRASLSCCFCVAWAPTSCCHCWCCCCPTCCAVFWSWVFWPPRDPPLPVAAAAETAVYWLPLLGLCLWHSSLPIRTKVTSVSKSYNQSQSRT